MIFNINFCWVTSVMFSDAVASGDCSVIMIMADKKRPHRLVLIMKVSATTVVHRGLQMRACGGNL